MISLLLAVAMFLTMVVLAYWDEWVTQPLAAVFIEMGRLLEFKRFVRYVSQYRYVGRHRRDNPPRDSEVDRWVGADSDFALFLHSLNQQIRVNAR